jgi:hypothetical protein
MGQMDEFYRGADLGLKVSSQRQQQEQFKTNLAERSRQFDLNHTIQVDSHNLRRREFTHKQEQSIVENKYRIAATNRIGFLNKEANRLAEEEETFGPKVTGYEVSLQKWNGEDNLPKLPSGLPPAQRDRALSMQKEAVDIRRSGRMAQAQEKHRTSMEDKYLEGFLYLEEYNPTLITQDPQTGQYGYDYQKLLDFKTLQAKEQRYRSVMGLTGLTPSSAVTTDKKGGTQTQWGTKTPSKSTRQELLLKSVSDFMTEEDSDGNATFNHEAFNEALRAAEGRPPSSSNVTNPDQIPDSSGLRTPPSGWRD